MGTSSSNKIRKAVIPAAGLGTRFLPATKSVPKELLPIVDIPTIQYIAQEIVDSGIETIVLVTGKGKAAIEDHFDLSRDLEQKLEKEGKTELAKRLREASCMVTTVSIRQREPRGLGHAVLCAKEVIGDEPFAVLLGDDLVDSQVPCTKQMIEIYDKYNKTVVALMEVSEEDVSKFGICGGSEVEDRVVELEQMVEKPDLAQAPSRLAIVGRYILTPEIFTALEATDPGKGGEIQLTDALIKVMHDSGVCGYKFKGKRYDAGDKFGFIQANIGFAMKRPSLRVKLLEYMHSILERENYSG